MTATDTLPDVIDRYMRAAEARDTDTLLGCFTPDATVTDEGKTYRGTDGIRDWRDGVASAWTYTTTVTGHERAEADRHILRIHLSGNFPGGEADVRFRFTLAGDRITDLTIG
ncbi:MAG TPA: nuclear transport factor 2 family protein [Thermomicrobiales bacterium]|jgi:ketosteroid isomerase-like protein|nr:nuclear transport factor 2 family protein [Thermomicrobiales bacterium]